MSAPHFFDTNILLYAGSRAAADTPKQKIAAKLIAELDFALSTQVLQEFIANALGKKALGLSEANVAATLESLRDIEVQPMTRELVEKAFFMRRKFTISYWDAAIVAAAQKLNCHTLYSEDLNHGQTYDGVQVVNPFCQKPPAKPEA